MAHSRPIKVTGHKRFHLRGRLNHFPRANLAGDSEASRDKIPFDKQKLAWLRSYVTTLEKLSATYSDEQDPASSKNWEAEARKQLAEQSPGSKPSADDVRLLAAQLSQGQGGDTRAADRAANSKADAWAAGNPNSWDGGSGTIGYGEAAGSPLTALGGGGSGAGGIGGLAMRGLRAAPGLIAAAVPSTAAAMEAIHSGHAVDSSGRLTDRGGVHSDPTKQVQGQGDDQIARLLAAHAAATKSGDSAKAQEISKQLQSFRYQDPAQKATELGNEAVGSVGSQVGRLALSGNPLATAAFAPVTNYLTGDKGGTAQMLANEAALYPAFAPANSAVGRLGEYSLGGASKAAPIAAAAAAGSGILGKAKAIGKNLLNPRLLTRGGALVGGVSGVSDLIRMGAGDGSFQNARDAGIRSNVMANDVAGPGAKVWNAAKAGLQAGFTGNLAPAREQVGAAYGRFDTNAATPMGRAYQEAQKDLKTQRGSNTGYEQTKETLRLDPRFKDMSPEDIEDLAARGATHGGSGAAVEANPGTGDASTRDLTAYTQSLDRYNQGKATPADLQQLEQLAGSPLQNGKMTPEQQQMAGRNAMLVHRLGRSDTNAVLGANLKPGQDGVVQPKPAMPAPQAAASPAQPALDPIHQLAQNVSKGDASAIQQLREWSATASPQDKASFSQALIDQQGGMASFGSKFMSQEQKNQMILKQVGDRAQTAGNEMGAQAQTDWAAEGGGVMNYLKDNPMLAMLPLGLLGMFSGSKMGKMLGILALAGGAYSMYQRYQGMKDPKFLGALAERAHGISGKTWTPEQQQAFEQQYGHQWHDISAAAGGMKVDLGDKARTLAVDEFQKALPGGANEQAAASGQPPPRQQQAAAKPETPAPAPAQPPQQPQPVKPQAAQPAPSQSAKTIPSSMAKPMTEPAMAAPKPPPIMPKPATPQSATVSKPVTSAPVTSSPAQPVVPKPAMPAPAAPAAPKVVA